MKKIIGSLVAEIILTDEAAERLECEDVIFEDFLIYYDEEEENSYSAQILLFEEGKEYFESDDLEILRDDVLYYIEEHEEVVEASVDIDLNEFELEESVKLNEGTIYPRKENPPAEALNNRIDFTTLNIELEKILKTDLEINMQVDKVNGKYIYISHENKTNIVSYTGVFEGIFKEVTIEGIASIFELENGTEELSVSIDLRWSKIDGGSNGGDIISAFYKFDTNKWIFRQ